MDGYVLIHDHHEGYISWEEFERNRRRRQRKELSWSRGDPPRRGLAARSLPMCPLQPQIACGLQRQHPTLCSDAGMIKDETAPKIASVGDHSDAPPKRAGLMDADGALNT